MSTTVNTVNMRSTGTSPSTGISLHAPRTPHSTQVLLSSKKLVVVPWHDPVVEEIGYDARSRYVELFWLNVLGPSATWILRRIAGGFDTYPGGYELDVPATAAAIGLAFSDRPNNPFTRAVRRCLWFGIAQPMQGGLAVRRTLPPVSHHHLARMPRELRRLHDSWLIDAEIGTDNCNHQYARATALAQVLIESGEEPSLIETQLTRLDVPPGIAARVSWALVHRHATTAQSSA